MFFRLSNYVDDILHILLMSHYEASRMTSTLLRTVPRALPRLTLLYQQRLTPLVSLNIARMATSGTRVATLDASILSPIA